MNNTPSNQAEEGAQCALSQCSTAQLNHLKADKRAIFKLKIDQNTLLNQPHEWLLDTAASTGSWDNLRMRILTFKISTMRI